MKTILKDSIKALAAGILEKTKDPDNAVRAVALDVAELLNNEVRIDAGRPAVLIASAMKELVPAKKSKRPGYYTKLLSLVGDLNSLK